MLTDIMGASGRAMVEALITGTDSAETIADLARGPLRRKHNDLVAALEGQVGPNQRLLLASHLRNLEFLTQEIERLTAEIEAQLRPSQDLLERLDTIPEVGPRVAQAILAEIGADVSRFPTGAHLASWARVCPSNDESAGKRRSSHFGPGNPWLRATLVEAAWAATHAKHTYLAAQYRRLAARRGGKRALVAVAHTILIIAYRIIRDGGTYEDLGSNYFDERDRRATLRPTRRAAWLQGHRRGGCLTPPRGRIFGGIWVRVMPIDVRCTRFRTAAAKTTRGCSPSLAQ